jgi:hypothetical protein
MRTSSPLTASAFGLFLLAAPLGAQGFGPSVLELLPTEGRVVTVGSAVEGQLGGPTDYQLPDGMPVQAWEIRGAAGAWVWVDLISDEFDAYLHVVDGLWGGLLSDDDSGGACHSRIPLELPESGVTTAIVAMNGFATPGAFTLRVSEEESPMVDEPCAYGGRFDDEDYDWGSDLSEPLPEERAVVGRIESIPSLVSGTLSESLGVVSPRGAPMATWEVDLVAGQIIQIDLVSLDFDAFLFFSGPGIEGYLSDDDSGGELNSQLVFTVLVGGRYEIHVSAFGATGAGEYTLQVESLMEPASATQ